MTEQPHPRDLNPEKFDRLLRFFREMRDVTGDIQQDIVKALLETPKFKAKIDKDSRQSEELMTRQIDRGIKMFISIMPIAVANEVNVFMSAMSMHSAITKDPLMAAIVEALNEEEFDKL